MDGWMDEKKEKQRFGPVTGCHRMGEDDKERKGWVCV